MPLAGAVCDVCAVCSVAVVIRIPDAVLQRLKPRRSCRSYCTTDFTTEVGPSRQRISRRAGTIPCGQRNYWATVEATGCALSCFFFQSPIAARIASSASTEQWIFTGGSESSFTMSMFLMARAWSTVLPLTHSVANDDDAIAEPQPNVLNLASSLTLVSRLTLICNSITSPHSR